MATVASSSDRWLSLHLYLQEGIDGFLASLLPEFLAAESGSFRRFFFLRYSEGGLHLRLRFLRPGPGLGRRLQGFVAGRLSGAGFRLEAEPYDRTLHYFGETPASVYAELLNEATSQLAIRLLGALSGQGRLQRWLVLTAALDLLADSFSGDSDAKRDFLFRSRGFAAETAEAFFGAEAAPALAEGSWVAPRRTTQLALVRSRLAPDLLGDRRYRHLAALLRRAGRSAGDGSFVSLHALHLFCNKLGFSLLEEHAAYAALLHLAGMSLDPPPLSPRKAQ